MVRAEISVEQTSLGADLTVFVCRQAGTSSCEGEVCLASLRGLGFSQYLAGGFKIGLGIDASRHGVDEGDVNPHAGLERP